MKEEIDFSKLFQILWNKKVFILIFTFCATLFSLTYVLLKKTIPIYEGKVLIEIGEIHNEKFKLKTLDSIENLKLILEAKNIKVKIPKKTDRLIILSFSSSQKETIEKKLKENVDFILEKHKLKGRFYNNVTLSQQIGDIVISDRPINSQKQSLIILVTFFTALFLSIFFVLLNNFIKDFKS
ncbi:Wzz/FepE/Etk N-terminal domain-containing protein [Arcobacter arenosus]|uniref:Wzz/FepE/Etk N-terminal domain-containing protein n=1 Tax=Arcobacter arenosus TaxID=2576037 RepID=UPI003BACE300